MAKYFQSTKCRVNDPVSHNTVMWYDGSVTCLFVLVFYPCSYCGHRLTTKISWTSWDSGLPFSSNIKQRCSIVHRQCFSAGSCVIDRELCNIDKLCVVVGGQCMSLFTWQAKMLNNFILFDCLFTRQRHSGDWKFIIFRTGFKVQVFEIPAIVVSV